MHRNLVRQAHAGHLVQGVVAANVGRDCRQMLPIAQAGGVKSTHAPVVVADDYRRVGGFHTAGLSDGHQLLVIATDIGRHNTLDKVAGECLARNISMQDTILLTTGRVSVEMLGKAARMKVPVVATLNSPTHLAVELGREWDITLIGYARGNKMHIYTGLQRVHAASAAAYAAPNPGPGRQPGAVAL